MSKPLQYLSKNYKNDVMVIDGKDTVKTKENYGKTSKDLPFPFLLQTF
jgi:hypothetical protein